MYYQKLSVRNGNHVLRFYGQELSSSSSQRDGVQRWSELTMYQTAAGDIILQKVGRSTVCHRPECHRVNHRMPSWLDAHEEAKVHRTPCVECQPLVGDQMDPHTRLEPQRYTVLQSPSLHGMYHLLADGRSASDLPALIKNLFIQEQENEL